MVVPLPPAHIRDVVSCAELTPPSAGFPLPHSFHCLPFSFPCFFPSSHSCLMSGRISWDVLLTQPRRDLPMVLLPSLLALGVELAHGRCCHNGRMWWRRTCNSGAGCSHLVVVRCFLLAPCIQVCLHQMQQPQVPQCILCTLCSNSFAKTKFQFQ